MLYVSRKEAEHIHLLTPEGTRIVVRIHRVKGMPGNQQVTLGIDAPEDYTILREELIDADTA